MILQLVDSISSLGVTLKYGPLTRNMLEIIGTSCYSVVFVSDPKIGSGNSPTNGLECILCRNVLRADLSEAEEKYSDLKTVQDRVEEDLKNIQEELSHRSHEVDPLISHADPYDSASIEAKKMIFGCLIRRVDVYRGCRLKVEFHFNLEQYLSGMERENFPGK